jgi:hypothetical protein
LQKPGIETMPGFLLWTKPMLNPPSISFAHVLPLTTITGFARDSREWTRIKAVSASPEIRGDWRDWRAGMIRGAGRCE